MVCVEKILSFSFFEQSNVKVARFSWAGLEGRMLHMSKITELYGEWLNTCVKYLSVNTCAFLITLFLMCLLFSLFFDFRTL